METLKNQKLWVNWKYEVQDGRETKVLYHPSNYQASSTNPKTWSNYEEVLKAKDKFNGIGVVFPLDKKILGIDLDHCISQPFGKVDQVNKDVIEVLIEQADT